MALPRFHDSNAEDYLIEARSHTGTSSFEFHSAPFFFCQCEPNFLLIVAKMDADFDTYTHYPIIVDPSSKALSIPTSSPSDPTLSSTLESINALHTSLKSLDTPNSVPPAPQPKNPVTAKRTQQTNKLRESATQAHRKKNYTFAVELYTHAITMAGGRPAWEPITLIREELSALYRERAASHVELRNWVDGWKDSEASIECKRPQGLNLPGKGNAWARGGKCLMELGRFGEAVEWLGRGVDCEGVGAQIGQGKAGGEEGKELRDMLAEAGRRAGEIKGL